MAVYTIDLSPVIQLTDEQFYNLCQANSDIKLERKSTGEILINSCSGGEQGIFNANLSAEVALWNRKIQLGVGFDSSTGFRLPNGSVRSPDVAWIKQDRWDALTPAQKAKFSPIAPDFILELLSPSDDLSDTQAKMREYIENGVKLGWLLNRKTRRAEIYRPNQAVEVLDAPETLSGENVMPGFVLNLRSLW